MVLKDLRQGDEIVLGIVWGDNHYRIANNVIAQKDEGIIIHAVLCKGEVLDLGSKRLSDMVYQISTQDKTDGHLITWNSVQMEKITYNGQLSYFVKAPAFAQLAIHNERRKQKRTVIDVQCRVEYDENNAPVRVKGIVHDISDSGIAFYIAGSVLDGKKAYALEWKDTAREMPFHLRIHCTSVRTVQQTGHTLVGCVITKSDPNLLQYIIYKRMDRPEDPDEE